MLWRDGATRLVDYGPVDGTPLLVVPSLINKAYVLDLLPEMSLLRHLSGAGVGPMLVDWGKPGDAERGFGLDDYIAGRLERGGRGGGRTNGAEARGAGLLHGRPSRGGAGAAPPRSGLRLGAAGDAVGFPRRARGAGAAPRPTRRAAGRELRRHWAKCRSTCCRLFFLANDPLTAARKFTNLTKLAAGSDAERRFVALEDWLNDGVPLAIGVAADSLGPLVRRQHAGAGQMARRRPAGPAGRSGGAEPGTGAAPGQDRAAA